MNPIANKRRGSQFEIDLLSYLRQRELSAERLRLTGRRDEGDLVFHLGGYHFVIEAKAEKTIGLAGYMTELEVEKENYSKARNLRDRYLVHGVAVVKAPRKSTGEAYAVLRLDDFCDMLDELLQG